MTMRIAQLENERGIMEQAPGTPCQCGICKGQREPLLPGDPDRHDMAAGDRVVFAIAQA